MKKTIFLIMSLLCLSFVLALEDVSITSPEEGAVLRGNVVLTGIVNYGDDPVSVTAATFSLGENSYTVESIMPNQTEFSTEINTSLLNDGTYTLSFNVSQDTSVPLIDSQVVIVDNVDAVPPSITSFSVNTKTLENGGTVFLNLEGFRTLTMEVTDDFSGVNTITALFSNETDELNLAFINGSAEVNFSTFSEGNYSVKIIVTDNANNSIENTYYMVTDRIKPSVTATCDPSEVTEGNRVSCSCSGSDLNGFSRLPLFGDGSNEESTTASGIGEKESSLCEAIDRAGNYNSVKGTYKVLAQNSGGGGGSSGSSGGVSGRVKGQLEKKTWTSILAGETAKLTLTNGELAITEVGFKVNKNTYGVTLEVKKLDEKPKGFTRQVYKHLDIKQTNLKNLDDGLIQIKFKILKNWFISKKLQYNKIALYHLEGQKWAELPTFVRTEDKEYVYYSSASRSLSPFVIGEKEIVKEEIEEETVSLTAPEVVEPLIPDDEEIIEEQQQQDKIIQQEIENEMKKAKFVKVLLIILIVILIMGLIGFIYWYNKHKEEPSPESEIVIA